MADAENKAQPEFEPPVLIPIETLGKKHLGWYTVDTLGARGVGMPPLVAANVELTEGLVDRIIASRDKLGPGGTPLFNIRLKNRAETVAPPESPILPRQQQHAVFNAMEVTFDEVREQLIDLVGDPLKFVLKTEEEAIETIRSIKIEVSKQLRQTLTAAIQGIMENRNQATLFACMEKHGEAESDHALRVFMMGTKVLAKHFGVSPERTPSHKRLMNYSLGLMFHDVGKIFLPHSIMQKQFRLPEDELSEIGRLIQVRGFPQRWLTALRAVNDPRYVYKPTVEKRFIDEIHEMRDLVKEKVMTEVQYSAVKRFPHYSTLSAPEQALIEKHPIFGWELVRDATRSPQALDIVRHHHQRLDTSGYPPMKAAMTMEAQIAAGVDTFDALVSERPYSTAKPYDIAFAILDSLTQSGSGAVPRLDRHIFELFCATVQKYPTGSFVLLKGGEHDGCVGQVVQYSPYLMDRPSFALFRSKDGTRLEHPLLFKKEDYDGSFRISGLPFTESVAAQMLRTE